MTRPPAGPETLTRELLTGSGARHTSVRTATERLIAVGYGLTYDAVVAGFPPYERLLEEITTLVARSSPAVTRSSSPTGGPRACVTRSARSARATAPWRRFAHYAGCCPPRSSRPSGTSTGAISARTTSARR